MSFLERFQLLIASFSVLIVFFMRTLFIFRQDLRLHDNKGLLEAMRNSKKILPIFILDSNIRKEFGVKDPRFWFILEAVEVLDRELQKYGGRLSVYIGDPLEVVKDIIQKEKISSIFANRSYSPYGKKRDDAINDFALSRGIPYVLVKDFLLVEPEEVEVRKVFTPFSKLWRKHIEFNHIYASPISFDIEDELLWWINWYIPLERRDIWEVFWYPKFHPYWTIPFGKSRLKINWDTYDDTRNFPWIDGSTRLSPYIRFWIFSIRELFRQFQYNPTIINELAWREFWYHIAYYFPNIYYEEFQEKKRHIQWEMNDYLWSKFQNGETGYPLIDAAIRQLYETNWMHNRLRMVVASFLTKNLWIDWRRGEKWFRQYLIDYDEAINIGNWQWSASVGADPKPIRIFNPLLQSERFDLQAVFIKKYLPELQGVSAKDIHSLNLSHLYIPTIVDQKLSAAKAKERYK